jgi:hypothetical protein
MIEFYSIVEFTESQKLWFTLEKGNVIGHSSSSQTFDFWSGQTKKSFIVNGKIKRKYIQPLNHLLEPIL